MSRPHGPAYRIETARTRLRCFAPEDTALLDNAIRESVSHLAPSMPWTRHEPLDFERRLVWVRTQRGHFDLDSDYTYGVFTEDDAVCIGVALLRLSPELGERELGYWIHAHHLRQGYASEVAAALVRVAFEIEALATLELTMLPENEASRGVAQKLGFSGPTLRPMAHASGDGEPRDVHVYTLSRLVYQGGVRAPIKAFDALGRQLL